MTPPPGRVGTWRSYLFALVISALVAFVYWPGVHGFWGRDDFLQLAFARLLGTPWPLFVHDHFPVPSSVFRPLGFASMWLCEALFGTDYEAHATADLALHVGVSLALFGLLRRANIPHVIALFCTLLFALHPAVIGTALWWSARFDLLATLFVLLALYAAFAYRESRGGAGALVGMLAAALAAMLSKEIGLVGIAAVSLVWLNWAWSEPTHRAQALRAVVLSWFCALIYIGWRWFVLGTLSSGLTGAMSMDSAIAKGLLDWLREAPDYLTFWLRLNVPQRVMLGFAVVLAAAVTDITVALHRSRFAWRRYLDLTLCGLSLMLLPALVQAPVAAFASSLNADVSAVEVAMQSRLYYLGIAGAMAALAAVLATFWKASGAKLRVVLVLPLALATATFAWVSHDSAQAFATRSVDISGVAREAVAAVAQLELPSSQCHVMFLGVEPPPEWSVYVSMDSIIKALSPDLGRVKHCWFHSNSVTYLQVAPTMPADAAPYRPLEADGRTVPWRTVGDLVIAYLRPPERVSASELARMKFLRYREGHFDDVSADVATGRVAVRLR